jgi:hypothetical protein
MLYNNKIKYFPRRVVIILAISAAMLTFGCAHRQVGESGGVQQENYPPETFGIFKEHYYQDETELFGGLPDDIRTYLFRLGTAFAAHDSAFLLSQGESEYEKEVRSKVDDDEYLALLYRAGVYAEDAEWQSPFALDLDRVTFIDYTSCQEYGPVLEIEGLIYMDTGRPLYCRIILLWRLVPPKILGALSNGLQH